MDEIFIARVVDPETVEKIDRDSVKKETLNEIGFTRLTIDNGKAIFVQNRPNKTGADFRSVVIDGQVTDVKYLTVERGEIGSNYKTRKIVFSVDDFWVPVPGDFAERNTAGGAFTGFFYADSAYRLTFTGHDTSSGRFVNELVTMNQLLNQLFKKMDPPKPPADK